MKTFCTRVVSVAVEHLYLTNLILKLAIPGEGLAHPTAASRFYYGFIEVTGVGGVESNITG